MKAEQFEIINDSRIHGLKLFFNRVRYRSMHLHSEFEILWVLEGRLWVRAADRRLVLEEGEMILFNSREAHELGGVAGSCLFACFQLRPSMLRRTFPQIDQIQFDAEGALKFLTKERENWFRMLLSAAMKGYVQQKVGYELLCSGSMVSSFYFLLQEIPWHLRNEQENREMEKSKDRLDRLINFVNQNFMRKLGLAEFAESEGLSMGYMSHFVKDNLGENFQEYLGSVRFHNACRLLRKTDMRLLDVSVACGYSDYRYFSKAFRKYTGKGPEEFRNSPEEIWTDQRDLKLGREIEDQWLFEGDASRELCRIYFPEEITLTLENINKNKT